MARLHSFISLQIFIDFLRAKFFKTSNICQVVSLIIGYGAIETWRNPEWPAPKTINLLKKLYCQSFDHFLWLVSFENLVLKEFSLCENVIEYRTTNNFF